MHDKMNLEQIENELFALRGDVIDIEKQMGLFAVNPVSPEWLPKAKAALRIKNLQIADLERRKGLLAGFETVGRAFTESARTLLDPALFQRIMDDAKERMMR